MTDRLEEVEQRLKSDDWEFGDFEWLIEEVRSRRLDVKLMAEEIERLRAALERLVGIGPEATLKEWRDAQAVGREALGRDSVT